MYRPLVLALLALSVSGCAGSVCERMQSAFDKVLAGQTKCEYVEGSTRVSISQDSSSSVLNKCEASLSKCTAEDMQVLEDYTACLEAAPACTPGNEKAATSAVLSCLGKLVEGNTPKLSSACAEAIVSN